MDNKPLEEQAENYLKSQLIKFDFNLAKPSFDKYGSDLIIVDKINTKKTKILLIQSKGRTLKNETFSNVTIPEKYVEKYFVLFIYTIDEEKEESLFMFNSKDIKEWNLNDHIYQLNFNKKKISSNYFLDRKFDKNQARNLDIILKATEIKNYTSIIIDGIFLDKAIKATKDIYLDIWPNKEYIIPSLNNVIKNILDYYDKFQGEKKIVSCYLINSVHFDYQNVEDFNENSNFKTKTGNQVNIFKNKTDSIVAFEVLEQIERLINNDNIILVADDRVYEEELYKHRKNGVEMIMVKLNPNNGGNMDTDFRWGDISYPLGISIGLEKHEL
ncbi:hypothetical protein [Wenyingzhuangia sp. 2_MG-2023]|uniref:hypothetical protein n=1 Tax=Wenyingzhuangia sp. 2_MG-2023 TaxID=3062639 RepID=UPI0026E33049|nr:hypothetical protein [Wenyingzhuangia sp. 2_MG-2023]MDO6739449.1 hypothetical protein [Wenyingzhuangia sp. 2_MG-2023]